MMPSSSSMKACFNSNCNGGGEASRKGWRRRTGEYAELCDRCGSAYEEGNFCETFHVNASGWRSCESCRKQVHCGCIVSFHLFVLLDAGGIECITCARKSFILTPNPAWPPPSLFLPMQPERPERFKDLSNKNWASISGYGPVPWRQTPSFNGYASHSDLHQGIDRFVVSKQLSASSLEKNKKEEHPERLINGSLDICAMDILGNGTAGIRYDAQPKPIVNGPQQSFLKDESFAPHFNNPATLASINEATDQSKLLGAHVMQSTPPPLVGNQFSNHNGIESSVDSQSRNGRPRGEGRARNQLLPRYCPRITDQELQLISGKYPTVRQFVVI